MKIPKVFTRINRKGLYPAEPLREYGKRGPGEKPFEERQNAHHYKPTPMTAEQMSFHDHLAHAVVHNYWHVLTDEERWEADCERALQNGLPPPKKPKQRNRGWFKPKEEAKDADE